MTVGEVISLVQSRVQGRVSSENEVHPASIRRYLDASVAEMTVAEYRQRLMMQPRRRGMTRTLVDPAFYEDRVLNVVRGSKANHPYAILSPRPLLMDDLVWLDSVRPELTGSVALSPSRAFRLLDSENRLRSTDADMLGGEVFTFYSGGRLWFLGLPIYVTQVRVRYTPSSQDAALTDRIPVPENMLGTIIDRTVEYFLGQRSVPVDYRSDDRDDAQNAPA